ncbi:S24 family peptidase [Aureimonas glaciei]|nr:S24 family peptidase [Aureimonas glaciei]
MTTDITLADRIRERLADLDTNPFAIAEKGSLERNFVNDILNGKKKSVRGDNLFKLAAALDTTPEWLLRQPGALKTGARVLALTPSPPGAPDAEETPYPRYPSNASPPVPVTFRNETIGMFGQAVGGEDGRFVLNGSRVMDVHCPPTLIGVKDAYGVFVHGGSMRPRYREGEAVFVNPHLPVRQDDYAIVQIKGDFEGDDIGGFIKQFISMNAKELVLAQHQRPETFPVEEASEGRYLLRFPRSKVAAVHRIVWAGEV